MLTSPKVRRQSGEFFNEHRVKSVVAAKNNLGCPPRGRGARRGSGRGTWGLILRFLATLALCEVYAHARSLVEPTRHGNWMSRRTMRPLALALMLADLLFAIVRHDIDHTLLLFPRFASDFAYTYEKLSFLAPEISSRQWHDALAARVNPTLIHERPLSRREQQLTVLGTAYNRGIARPIRGLRKLSRRGE